MSIGNRLENALETLERVSAYLPVAMATLFTFGVVFLIGLNVTLEIADKPSAARPARIERVDVQNVDLNKQPGLSKGCFVMPDGTQICGPNPEEML